MGLIIEDGKGSGRTVGISSENQLLVKATTEVEVSKASRLYGKCYTWTAYYKSGANDTILWLRNDSSSDVLLINKIIIASDVTTFTIVHLPDNTTPAGTLITGVNMNRLSGLVAEATCYRNETSNSISTIAAIAQCPVGSVFHLVDDKLILGKNDIVAVDMVSACSSLAGVTITGFFIDADLLKGD